MGGFYQNIGPGSHRIPYFPSRALKWQLRDIYASYGPNEFRQLFSAHGKLVGKPIFWGPPSGHAVAAATVLCGVVFWAGTQKLHRRRKTHARADSVPRMETMISTTPQVQGGGDPLGKVFPTTFFRPTGSWSGNPIFEPGNGVRGGFPRNGVRSPWKPPARRWAEQLHPPGAHLSVCRTVSGF